MPIYNFHTGKTTAEHLLFILIPVNPYKRTIFLLFLTVVKLLTPNIYCSLAVIFLFSKHLLTSNYSPIPH